MIIFLSLPFVSLFLSPILIRPGHLYTATFYRPPLSPLYPFHHLSLTYLTSLSKPLYCLPSTPSSTFYALILHDIPLPIYPRSTWTPIFNLFYYYVTIPASNNPPLYTSSLSSMHSSPCSHNRLSYLADYYLSLDAFSPPIPPVTTHPLLSNIFSCLTLKAPLSFIFPATISPFLLLSIPLFAAFCFQILKHSIFPSPSRFSCIDTWFYETFCATFRVFLFVWRIFLP